MASEEPTLEVAEPTLEEAEPPLSGVELRLLRLRLTRVAQPQLCYAHTVDFGRPPQPVQVDLVPLLGPADFDQAGLQRPPQPTFAQEARALIALLRWIIKALLGACGAATLALLAHYFWRRLVRHFRRYMDYFLPLPRNISLCLDFATVVVNFLEMQLLAEGMIRRQLWMLYAFSLFFEFFKATFTL
ncbi:unnamed protein product [Symbiodinium microadriaticum]|nr:unnamed protein product [Symbiodinium microadriaticum]CAE7883677.1 unnamed protein product [Symbiodinium sp. KB8]